MSSPAGKAHGKSDPGGVGEVDAEEDRSLPTDDAALMGDGEGQQQQGENGHHQEVEGSVAGDGNGGGGGAHPHHEEQVEDVGADHVADRDVGLPPVGGDQRGDKFRQAGAEGDHGQADQHLRYLKGLR